MKYVPKNLTRFGYRQLLKLDKNSPTILVVSGVVGLTATAVMAARATRNLDPIIEDHAKKRVDIGVLATSERDEQQKIVRLYAETAMHLSVLYGPTLLVGGLSTASVLYGHKILKGRHLATMAAYTGLMEQYQAYRARVSETVGSELERDIYAGAVGKWEDDPDHPGESKLKSKFEKQTASYLRPVFDESNRNWTPDPTANYLFLKGVQAHMNNMLNMRGHLFLFEVYDSLGIARPKESIVTGWLVGGHGDNYVDFGFMTDQSPQAVMFRNGAERSVWLNFNIDGVIWDLI